MRLEKSLASSTDIELPTRLAGVGVWCATTIISSIAGLFGSSAFSAKAKDFVSEVTRRVKKIKMAERALGLFMRNPMLRVAMVNQELSRV